MCSLVEVLQCEDLGDWDSGGCFEVPIARYVDDECAAVLWVSRSKPREQTVDVLLRDTTGAYGEVDMSGGTDWTPPPSGPPPGGTWLSGFVTTTVLPSGQRAVFITGMLGVEADVVTVGSSSKIQVAARDQRGGAFVVRIQDSDLGEVL